MIWYPWLILHFNWSGWQDNTFGHAYSAVHIKKQCERDRKDRLDLALTTNVCLFLWVQICTLPGEGKNKKRRQWSEAHWSQPIFGCAILFCKDKWSLCKLAWWMLSFYMKASWYESQKVSKFPGRVTHSTCTWCMSVQTLEWSQTQHSVLPDYFPFLFWGYYCTLTDGRTRLLTVEAMCSTCAVVTMH